MVLVSGTNGKTTLTAMLATIARGAGRRVTHNATGANLRSGLAACMMGAGRDADLVLLETDEATLPLVAGDLRPDVIVLGNLFRDQLDRYGELEMLADRWRQMLRELPADSTCVVANADDPLLAGLAGEWAADSLLERGETARIVRFGLDDESVGASELPHAADSRSCRSCGHPLAHAATYVGHLGSWRCAGCGMARPELDVSGSGIRLDGLSTTSLVLDLPDADPCTVRLRIPGLYNAYNAVAAAAAASAIGIPAAAIASGLESVSPAFGRFELVPVPDVGTLTLLLVKNPTGLNEVVRTLVGAGVDLGAVLFALNDGIADGRDTSWIWDADIEPLVNAAPSGIVVTGDRAAELALRLTYAGADEHMLAIDENLEQSLYELLRRARTHAAHGHAYALLTYTSLLEMREIITRRGWANAYWKRRNEHVRSTVGG